MIVNYTSFTYIKNKIQRSATKVNSIIISMNRPEVALENYRELQEYYSQIEPNWFVARAVHLASALVYKPHVYFEEGTKEAISEELSMGTRLLIACRHMYIDDQNAVAAAIQRENELRALVGNAFIPAKEPYFNKEFHGKKYLRQWLDRAGAVPVFRPQDIPDLHKDNHQLQAQVTRSFIDTAAQKIIRGQHMFIFPEGTRNRTDSKELLRINKGLGRIACAASKEVQVALLTIGLDYEPERTKWQRQRPHIYIGKLTPGPFNSPSEVTRIVEEGLIHDIAQARAKSTES